MLVLQVCYVIHEPFELLRHEPVRIASTECYVGRYLLTSPLRPQPNSIKRSKRIRYNDKTKKGIKNVPRFADPIRIHFVVIKDSSVSIVL